jgi:hypothetical protein
MCSLQRWQTGLGMQLNPDVDKHVCSDHFTEEQFCSSHNLFLEMTNKSGKKKLHNKGHPTLLGKGNFG